MLRLPNYHGEVAPAEVATKTEIQQQQTVLVLKFIFPNFKTDTVFSCCCVQSLVYAHHLNSARVHELQSSHSLVHAHGLVQTSQKLDDNSANNYSAYMYMY